MRRFLSIAICSIVLQGSSAFGLEWLISSNGGFSVVRQSGETAAYTLEIVIRRDGVVISNHLSSMFSTTYQRNIGVASVAGHYGFEVIRPTNALQSTGGNWGGVTGTWTNGTWQYEPPPTLATNAFTWQFPSEWGGSILQIQATNGQTLGTFGLPANIGSTGYTLSSSIITNATLLSNAVILADGQLVGLLGSSGSVSSWSAWRPGLNVTFDDTYQNGDWRIQRSDGSIALSGTVNTLNDAVAGRFTVTGTNTATMWTRVPGGDGNGGTWVQSPVSFGQNNNVTAYAFTSNPSPTPAPTPSVPTASPAPTVAPTPAPVPTNNPTTTTPAPVSTNDVTVDVDPLVPIETNDGEQGVLNQVVNTHEKIRGMLDDFREMFDNVALTFQEFRQLALGGVGTSCVFSLGPINMDLSGLVPPFVRNGMKLIILLVVVFAALRAVWETFSSV